MPSIQHKLLKLSLEGMTLSLPLRGEDIDKLRNMLDITALWMFIPWGVQFKQMKIGKLRAELLTPSKSNSSKIILYLHGGGYALGSSHTHRSMVGQIAKEMQIPALLVGYRKIPESPFPAALDDALKSYQWLLDQGYQANDIIIAGDSAGGGLAISTMLALKNKHIPLPSACFCLSPWTDLAVTGESVLKNSSNDPLIRVQKMRKWGEMYAAHRLLTNPLISPLYGDLRGLPPMLIQVSTGEILHDDSIRLAEAATLAGVSVTLQEWDDLIHWWHLFWRVIPEAQDAIKKIAHWYKEHQSFGKVEIIDSNVA